MLTYLLLFTACQEFDFDEHEEYDEEQEYDEDEEQGYSDDEQGEFTGQIQAIGDSFLDFYSEEEESIPHVIGNELGLEVQNNAVSGAVLLGSDGISSQYESGSWDWVIVNGGGNDLEEQCGCGDCDDYMDEIISEDALSGVLPELLYTIQEDGNRIVLMSYFSIPNEAEEFSACNDELAIMRERYQLFADNHEAVIFVDAGDVVSYDAQPEAYAEDLIQPSPEGSALIGAYVAERILDAQ